MLTVHINALCNESVHRKEQRTSGINTIPKKNSDFIDFTNFEVGIRTILSPPMCSLLSATSRHYSVLRRCARRTFRGMTTSVRNVGPSANSAL